MAKKSKRPAKKARPTAAKKVAKTNFKVVPLGDRVLVKPLDIKGEATTASGIIIPGKDTSEKHEKGIIIATGGGRVTVDGKRVPLEVKVGDKIWFKRGYDAEEVTVDGAELILTSEGNILAVEN